jgi:hypothetical protein
MARREHLSIGDMNDAYYGVLRIHPDMLAEASYNEDVMNLEYEELFKVLVEDYGAIPSYEEINRDDSTARIRKWYLDGTPEWEEHYKDDKLHDPDAETAAYKRWHKNGTLAWQAHCKNGIGSDADNGECAIKAWNENAKLTYVARYDKGGGLIGEVKGKPITSVGALKIEWKDSKAEKLPAYGDPYQIDAAFAGRKNMLQSSKP